MHIHNLYIYVHIFMCMRCKNIQIPTHTLFLSISLQSIHSFLENQLFQGAQTTAGSLQ